MEAFEILERAADEMQRRGKCEGTRMNESGQVCALGAMQVASGFIPRGLNIWDDWKEVRSDVINAMSPFLGTNKYGALAAIADWSNGNDAPTVIAGLKAVAATLRAQSPAQSQSAPALVTEVAA